jgi:hypothetical protein
METTLAHPDLEDLADSLDVLGPEGMSADESDEDDEGYPMPPAVRLHPWRSPAVSDWLRTLDDVFAYDKMTKNLIHEIPEDRQRTMTPFMGGVAVPGLPGNFYRSKWLKALTPQKAVDLQVQTPVVLQFSDKIKRYVFVLLLVDLTSDVNTDTGKPFSEEPWWIARTKVGFGRNFNVCWNSSFSLLKRSYLFIYIKYTKLEVFEIMFATITLR